MFFHFALFASVACGATQMLVPACFSFVLDLTPWKSIASFVFFAYLACHRWGTLPTYGGSSLEVNSLLFHFACFASVACGATQMLGPVCFSLVLYLTRRKSIAGLFFFAYFARDFAGTLGTCGGNTWKGKRLFLFTAFLTGVASRATQVLVLGFVSFVL